MYTLLYRFQLPAGIVVHSPVGRYNNVATCYLFICCCCYVVQRCRTQSATLLRWLLIDHLVTLILDTCISLPYYLLFLGNYFVNFYLVISLSISLVITGKKSLRRIPIWSSGACAPTSINLAIFHPSPPRSNHAQVAHAQYPIQAFYGLSEPRYPHSDPITHAQTRSWLPALLWNLGILRSPRYDQPVQGCRTGVL